MTLVRNFPGRKEERRLTALNTMNRTLETYVRESKSSDEKVAKEAAVKAERYKEEIARCFPADKIPSEDTVRVAMGVKTKLKRG